MRTSSDRKTFGRERHRPLHVRHRSLHVRLSTLENPVEGGRHEVHLGKRFRSQEDGRLENPREEPKLDRRGGPFDRSHLGVVETGGCRSKKRRSLFYDVTTLRRYDVRAEHLPDDAEPRQGDSAMMTEKNSTAEIETVRRQVKTHF